MKKKKKYRLMMLDSSQARDRRGFDHTASCISFSHWAKSQADRLHFPTYFEAQDSWSWKCTFPSDQKQGWLYAVLRKNHVHGSGGLGRGPSETRFQTLELTGQHFTFRTAMSISFEFNDFCFSWWAYTVPFMVSIHSGLGRWDQLIKR